MGGNRRLAVNTAILYVKFILTTIISFVTSRLILDALGASDYGLYNVVGGIVVMLNTLGTSMVATSYRYMAIEIGKGKSGNPNKVYNTVLCIHLFLAIFLLIIGETLGVYYVNNILNVDASKIPDALFVLHISLITTAFAVITIPTNGLIIAREKFLFTSSIEITSVLLKLCLIVLLLFIDDNKLRYYAVFLAICQLIMPVSYQIYCQIKDYEVVKWNFNNKITDYKDIFSFAWWILLGAIASLGRIQGVSIIMNIFFGTVINAAFGLATQVNSAISQFTASIQQAAVPQIMKRQGNGKVESSVSLVYIVSRFSFLIMMIIALPVILSIDSLLRIWLKEPPEYTNLFISLLIINAMISNLGAGFDASIQATGKIRANQIGFTIINLLILPIIFILYKVGFPAYLNVIVMIFLSIITLIFQIYIMSRLTTFNLNTYMLVTLKPVIKALVICCTFIIPVRLLFPCESTVNTLIFYIIAAVIAILCTFFIGFTKSERNRIVRIVKENNIKHE